jgi:hypothetical protein
VPTKGEGRQAKYGDPAQAFMSCGVRAFARSVALRIGPAKKEARRAFGFVKMHKAKVDEVVTRQSFHLHVDRSN